MSNETNSNSLITNKIDNSNLIEQLSHLERVANQIKLIFVIARAKRERMMHNYPSVSSPEARQILLLFSDTRAVLLRLIYLKTAGSYRLPLLKQQLNLTHVIK